MLAKWVKLSHQLPPLLLPALTTVLRLPMSHPHDAVFSPEEVLEVTTTLNNLLRPLRDFITVVNGLPFLRLHSSRSLSSRNSCRVLSMLSLTFMI